MGKRLIWVLVLAFFLAGVAVPSAYADDDASGYQIYINGEKFTYDYGPIVHKDAVYVPFYGVLGQMNISPIAGKSTGVLRIETPTHVYLTKPDSNVLYSFALDASNTKDKSENPTFTGFDYEFIRLDYPLIVKDWVIYVPIHFLTNYMGIEAAWGEDNTISLYGGNYDVTAGWEKVHQDIVAKYHKPYSYEQIKDYFLDKGINENVEELSVFTEAESLWSQYSTLWLDKLSYDWGDEHDHMQEVHLVGYSGLSATFSSSSHGEFTHTFKSVYAMKSAFYAEDPFAGTGWSSEVINLIKKQNIQVGMTETMVVYAWGKPSSVNQYGGLTQWSYRKGNGLPYVYFYFQDGVLTSIQKV
ncbi:stalk domain-containing protein [Paenibacillus sp. y28]|uniref:stalk domain-containing protein n=1 Tax=Paenibacillus sp. y28 TaxID=3129110 RepID=UPI00301859D6